MKYFDTPPTLHEIADRLSVVQRWNGYTTTPWTVLQHSLLVNYLLSPGASPSVRAVALLHDAAEAFIGDIPQPYKVSQQAVFEEGMLDEIYEGLYFRLDRDEEVVVDEFVKQADDLAALAEAQVICKPEQRYAVSEAYGPHDIKDLERGTEEVWAMRDMTRHHAVFTWCNFTTNVLEKVNVTD